MNIGTARWVLVLLLVLPVTASAAPEKTTAPTSVSSPEATKTPENMKCGYFDCISLEPLDDEVTYTVHEQNSVAAQASKWGVPSNVITTLNSGLTPETILKPGQKLLVDARLASEAVPYSSGRCNRGRLYHARLMPEVDGVFLRTYRPNSWGTDTTIQALTTLFKAYHKAYPDAQPINLGDISKRRGGKIKPHKSHQSGRDVDIGFAHLAIPDDKHKHDDKHDAKRKERFIRATQENLDLEKTWFIVETLVRTGTVKVIYVDRMVMKWLYNHVSGRLTQEQREFFFSNPRHSNSSSAILQHWPGHRNHFHVRFNCPPDQPGCRH
ncbi:MAG: penicillin-insensitive murein endopeptidase [Proteobacteria bacterium]|nr:penicillin-insensitive murein endopeptidase [Pseudomonadota bacterium]